MMHDAVNMLQLQQKADTTYVDPNFLNEKTDGIMLALLSMNRNELIGIKDKATFGYYAINKLCYHRIE